MKALRLFAAGLCVGLVLAPRLAGLAQPPTSGQTPTQRGPVALPKNALLPVVLTFTTWNGLAIVTGRINGTDEERFVLDTGLNACTITPSAYARLKLKATNTPVRVNVLDQVTTTTDVLFTKFQVQNLTLADVPVALLDVFSLLSRATRADAPTAWLGSPFLSAFQVTFDFSMRFALLEAPQAALPKAPGTVVLPITLREGRVFVQVVVPGAKPFLALVDTGTTGTLLPGDIADRLKLKPSQVFTVSRPGGQEAKAGLVLLPKLHIGKIELKDVRVIALASDAPKEFDRALGVLGTDILSRYKVTINYAKKKLALSPLAPLPSPGTPAGSVPPLEKSQ